jgi:hypothetical protein
MYVKLQFTSNKTWQTGFRILTQAINDPAVVSTGTLAASIADAGGHSDLITGIDYVNSTVIRNNLAANVIAHYSTPTTGSNSGEFTLRFPVYDSPGNYFYYQLLSNDLTTVYTLKQVYAKTISTGAIDSGIKALNASNSGASLGTPVVLGGSDIYTSTALPFVAASQLTIRTFWFYVNDKSFIWCTTHVTTYVLGFGPTYGDNTAFSGPYIASQYTRYDYHNTMANGVTPVMITNDRTNGAGFGVSGDDWDAAHSVIYSSPRAVGAAPFLVFNLVSAAPQVGSSWPLINQPLVNWSVAGRYDEVFGLTTDGGTQSAGARTNSYSKPVLFTTVSTRYPSADLKSTAFAMMPILWRNSYYGNTGGNSSAQSGIYLFNGDYFPGDEFTYGGKTYSIWPTYSGFSARIGIAVPKE